MNGTRMCSASECHAGIYARSLCKSHYRQAQLRGDFTPSPRYAAADALAVRVEAQGDCLIWTGYTKSDGYGQMKVSGKVRAVHQVAWEQAHGEIPAGKEIDHTCHNPGCVNVKHLRLASRAENNRNLSGPKTNNRSTGVRNVYPNGSGFHVQIKKGDRMYHFGTYASVEEAQEAAEAARVKLFGDFAGKTVLTAALTTPVTEPEPS